MDNNKGNFVQITEGQFDEKIISDTPQVFKVGEVIEVGGSKLRVQRINKNKITFKLLRK